MSGGRDLNQQIAERRRRGLGFLLSELADAARAKLGARAVRADPCLWCWTTTPFQMRQFAAESVEPRRLSRAVAIMALLNMGGPTTAEPANPSTRRRRPRQIIARPGQRKRGMLENATPFPYGGECCGEASAIIANGMPISSLVDRRHLAPAVAGGMGNDGIIAGIVAGVACDIPEIYPVEPCVAAGLLDVECGEVWFHSQPTRSIKACGEIVRIHSTAASGSKNAAT